jgi:hypothetical protein
VAIASLGGSCDQPLSLAVGPAGDVTVFSTHPAESPALKTLIEGLEREVVFIGRPELAFNVEFSEPDGFRVRRKWRNLVFVGSLDEDSWVSEMIQSLLTEAHLSELREESRKLFFLKDKWAVGQMIAIVTSPRSSGLEAAVRDNMGALFETLDRAAVNNTRRIMLKKDVQHEAAGYLLQQYGWRITFPEGFEGEFEDSENKVVLFRAIEPARILLVHWQYGFRGRLTPERCLTERAEAAWTYYDEDRIDYDLTTSTRITFMGRDAIKLTGIWQNEKHVSGGPFTSFCFAERGRFYLIDLVLFAPGTEKLSYMRELEAIAQTFSTE